MTKRVGIVAGLVTSLLVLATGVHAGDRNEQADSLGGTGVTLYEISERVTFDPDPSSAGVIKRNATSPLQGFAEVGTPLCPSELLISDPGMKSCTVIATGTDSVSTVTGVGPVSGTFDVVINAPGNSSVHVPDLPVISGTFSGNVDLSLAVLRHVPIGWIAVGDPAQLFPPHEHERIWAVQRELDFPGYVFGLQRPGEGETIMPELTRRYSRALGQYQEGQTIDDKP